MSAQRVVALCKEMLGVWPAISAHGCYSTLIGVESNHRLYFSAHWCPPCRRYTPVLAEAYNAHVAYLLKAKDEKDMEGEDVGEIEVIFVSSDSVKSEYDAYRSSMPWLSVPFSNLHKLRIKDELSKKYGVRGIPMLVVLDGKTGEVITLNGRGEYGSYFKGRYAGSQGSSGCTVS